MGTELPIVWLVTVKVRVKPAASIAMLLSGIEAVPQRGVFTIFAGSTRMNAELALQRYQEQFPELIVEEHLIRYCQVDEPIWVRRSGVL